ncbi:EboA domain-containing protein [Streptomyces flavofungini]|uniref:EboA domain-containing protein n=1 Tax=Streptomyces flavofungini TaxID=68200 RepID=UPI0025B12586|nr:EboA domain-containing protein [Streptomyces flavofungini]WJV45208.1 EboA domain-containing protein [Streptomyces flavofungini]
MSHSPRAFTADLPTAADLRSRLDAALDDPARAWLDRAATAVAAHPVDRASAQATPAQATSAQGAPAQGSPVQATPAWELRFAEAGRRCGPDHADAARLVLLHAAHADTATLTRLYEQGTATERRAVLNALPHLVSGPDALPLVQDALRTNDTRLVAAALGPYAAVHLGPHDWRHAVLKCLFTGVPVAAVAGLAHRARADAELARMLGDYAAERTAAGRDVPGDLYRVLALTDEPAATDGGSPATTGPDDRATRPDHPAAANPDHSAAPAPFAAPSTSTGEDQES